MMDINLLLDAELRAAVAEAKCEAMQAEIDECEAEATSCKAEFDACQTRLQAEQLLNADLNGRLESERAERARSDAIINQMLAQMREMMAEDKAEDAAEVTPQWSFQIHRDGADKMIGVTARSST